MTGRRHRSNCELVAQGIANIASALFGGICVTGTIARTATNVRAGARGPVSGMLHALFLLLFMLVAAPLAAYIPLAALAGVLVVVAWNMAEKARLRHPAARLARRCRGAARDLPADGVPRPDRGILVGFGSARCCSCTAWRRRSRSSAAAVIEPDLADEANGDRRTRYDPDASPPIPTSSSIGSPARSSSARPPVSQPRSTASARSRRLMSSISRRCRSSIRPPPRPSRFARKVARHGAAVSIAGHLTGDPARAAGARVRPPSVRTNRAWPMRSLRRGRAQATPAATSSNPSRDTCPARRPCFPSRCAGSFR